MVRFVITPCFSHLPDLSGATRLAGVDGDPAEDTPDRRLSLRGRDRSIVTSRTGCRPGGALAVRTAELATGCDCRRLVHGDLDCRKYGGLMSWAARPRGLAVSHRTGSLPPRYAVFPAHSLAQFDSLAPACVRNRYGRTEVCRVKTVLQGSLREAGKPQNAGVYGKTDGLKKIVATPY